MYHVGDLIGFTCLTEGVTSKLDLLEKEDNNSIPRELLANSMMTFMVEGLFTQPQFPYAYFQSRSTIGCQIFDPLWESCESARETRISG